MHYTDSARAPSLQSAPETTAGGVLREKNAARSRGRSAGLRLDVVQLVQRLEVVLDHRLELRRQVAGDLLDRLCPLGRGQRAPVLAELRSFFSSTLPGPLPPMMLLSGRPGCSGCRLPGPGCRPRRRWGTGRRCTAPFCWFSSSLIFSSRRKTIFFWMSCVFSPPRARSSRRPLLSISLADVRQVLRVGRPVLHVEEHERGDHLVAVGGVGHVVEQADDRAGACSFWIRACSATAL